MSVVRLVCWKEDEAHARARVLKQAGFQVDASPVNVSGIVGQFRANPPSAVLIDLDRLPSHGSAVATVLRRSKSTRFIPLVLVGGAEEKVQRVREQVPDAVFTGWAGVKRALSKALKNTPENPFVPAPPMAKYVASSLAKKLGLKASMKVALLGAPDDFEDKLGDLPEAIEFHPDITRGTNLAIWFVRSRGELEEFGYFDARMPEGSAIWVVHLKQTSRYRSDFNQYDVRAVGVAAGWVDFKICAVDSDWTGLKFARKKK